MNAKHSPGEWRAEFVGVAGPQDNPSHDVFEITNGHDRITELGQLTITDRRDAQKTMRMSQVDTARLALALKRWATLIDVREAA